MTAPRETRLDSRALTEAGFPAGTTQARSAISTLHERTSQHPGLVFGAAMGLVISVMFFRAAFDRQ